MAQFNDLTISELMKILADKTLRANNMAEIEKLSTHDDLRGLGGLHGGAIFTFPCLNPYFRRPIADILQAYSRIESACTLLPDIHSVLRRAANSRAHVNTLPSEVLLNIFAFIPQAPTFTAFNTVESICGPLTTRQVWELRAVTQVCHRWRSLALNVSCLWSSIFRKPYLVSRCGVIPDDASHPSRCIAGPMQMYVEEDGIILSQWEPLAAIDAPQDYEDRVEELHVVTADGWKHGILPPSLLSPQLNSLKRLIVRSMHFGTFATPSWQWHGLQPMFQGQTLPLRSLAIIDAPFLPSNPAPALTRLVLFYDMKRDMRETWTHRDLLRFLAAVAPTLEEAVICGVPCLGIREPDREGPSVHLPRMRKFSLRCWNYLNPGSPHAPLPLLPHITTPQHCYVRFDAHEVSDLWVLADQLQRRQQEWEVPTSNVHCVWASSPYTMSSLQATFPGPDGEGSGGGGGVRVDFPAVLNRLYDETFSSAVGTLLATPPFAAAEALWVSGAGVDDTYEKQLTQAALGRLRHVKALYVATDPLGGEPTRLVESLKAPPASTRRSVPGLLKLPPPMPPFRELETLCVPVYGRPGVEKLAEMLRHREAKGCRLSHLLVGRAEVGDEDDEVEGEEEEEGEDAATRVPGDFEELYAALRGAVGKVTVLSEEGYEKDYALRTVLPPICTRPGGGLIWPPWTENETTFALMHLT